MKSLLSVFPHRPPIVYYPPKNYTVEELNRKPTHFDPKYYEDYAIWYGQTLGMEYDLTIGDFTDWGGDDNPVGNCSWESMFYFDKDTNDESIKEDIRGWLEYYHSDRRIMHEPKAEYFRVGAYTEEFINLSWPGMFYSPDKDTYWFIIFNDPI